MNTLKPRFSTRGTKLAKLNKRDSRFSRRNKLLYHRHIKNPNNLVNNMTFDEMLEASSLLDSLINGASYVNQSTVSPKARLFVQRTHDKYKKHPRLLEAVYKNLNKEIVVVNHGLYRSDPKSELLYAQLMNAGNKVIAASDAARNARQGTK